MQDSNPQQKILAEFKEHLGKEWAWIAIRGVVAIIFGLMALAWPMATLWALTIMWGAFAFADGAFAFAVGWRLHKKGVRWWPYLVFGVIGVLIGIVTILWPAVTAITLVYIIGFWALFGGLSQLVAAIRLRKEIEGEWLLALAGLIGVAFGLLILFRPLTEGIAVITGFVGIYAVMVGVIFLMLAFKVRNK